ncbi:torsin-1A-interacting protein 2-like [Syngnathoides biaculeatus]|uniref:torsin-1A-interacting protein 2-like n=1 Tax=Syngnathoides biaculeatus TaxID=300417 RepID=UPI002ADD915B|nr:torsin-1A-interacting protein 2-like [Syngnathoides biaculeatus]
MAEPLDPAVTLQKKAAAAGVKKDDDQSRANITQQQHCLDSDQRDEKTVVMSDGWRQDELLNQVNVEKGAILPPDLAGHGDDNNDCKGAERDGEPPMKEKFAAGVGQSQGEEAPEHTTPAIDSDTDHDHADNPIEMLQEDALLLNDTNNDDQKEARIGNAEEEETAQVPRKASLEELMNDRTTNVETVRATTRETTDFEPTAIPGVRRYLVVIGVLLVLVAIAVQRFFWLEPPPQSVNPTIDIFLRQLEKVESRFPRQRPELWNRSRIHLKRHLLTQCPSEPVSLILTAGVAGRQTLRCLAHDLAFAFSSALNGSVLHIDGASRAGDDSGQVKLDIDSQLQRAFEGDKPSAVIHRFEQLPPASTLIFYRYCDHENAAYKKTFLIFTVLLEEEEDIPAGTSLSAVEEMVDDHLQRKFLSHGRPLAFDRMDLDKYGGLWSRISHLTLPVSVEAWTEHEICS